MQLLRACLILTTLTALSLLTGPAYAQPPLKPVLIFLHGSPPLGEQFQPYNDDPDLRAAAEIIADDRPGFGSKTSRRFVPFVEQVHDVVAKVENASGPVTLVGYSYGAVIAMAAAQVTGRFIPGKIQNLVLIAGTYNPAHVSNHILLRASQWPILGKVYPLSIKQSHFEIEALPRDLADTVRGLAHITARITAIHGSHDPLTPEKDLDVISQAGGTVFTLNQADHSIIQSEFSFIKRELLRLLKLGK